MAGQSAATHLVVRLFNFCLRRVLGHAERLVVILASLFCRVQRCRRVEMPPLRRRREGGGRRAARAEQRCAADGGRCGRCPRRKATHVAAQRRCNCRVLMAIRGMQNIMWAGWNQPLQSRDPVRSNHVETQRKTPRRGRLERRRARAVRLGMRKESMNCMVRAKATYAQLGGEHRCERSTNNCASRFD
jgi:hypothetical protein